MSKVAARAFVVSLAVAVITSAHDAAACRLHGSTRAERVAIERVATGAEERGRGRTRWTKLEAPRQMPTSGRGADAGSLSLVGPDATRGAAPDDAEQRTSAGGTDSVAKLRRKRKVRKWALALRVNVRPDDLRAALARSLLAG